MKVAGEALLAGPGIFSSPTNVMSRNAGVATARSTLMRSAPAARAAGRGIRRRSRAPWYRRDERMQRERLDGQRARAAQRGLDRRALDGLDVSISARAWSGTSPTASGRGPERSTTRRHLDHRAARRGTAAPSVGGVDDQLGARVRGDRLDHGHRLALVAAAFVLGVAALDARLGHVAGVALGARGAPGRQRVAVAGVERLLLVEQVLAARRPRIPSIASSPK